MSIRQRVTQLLHVGPEQVFGAWRVSCQHLLSVSPCCLCHCVAYFSHLVGQRDNPDCTCYRESASHRVYIFIGCNAFMDGASHELCTCVCQGCTRQAAVERQDLSCRYLAHHELESILILIILLFACQQFGCLLLQVLVSALSVQLAYWISTALRASRRTALSSCASTWPMSACSSSSTSTSSRESRYAMQSCVPACHKHCTGAVSLRLCGMRLSPLYLLPSKLNTGNEGCHLL